MSNSHKKFLQQSIRGRRWAGHSSPLRTLRRRAVKRDGERAMPERERGEVTCQIFIEQRKGGTVWVPRQTLIADRVGNQIIIGHQGENFNSGDQFPTLGSAAEAAQQKALNIIQQKHPIVRKDDVDWHLVSEDVRGFVTV